MVKCQDNEMSALNDPNLERVAQGQVEFLPVPVVPALCLVSCGAREALAIASRVPKG